MNPQSKPADELGSGGKGDLPFNSARAEAGRDAGVAPPNLLADRARGTVGGGGRRRHTPEPPAREGSSASPPVARCSLLGP
uniref:Uncharacterized protein n=1 Tax=Oryza brachyantha TaxID=4533 RepID=J3LTB1_ORYBR